MFKAIEISHLSKTFGTGKKKRLYVNGIDLAVNQGEIFGFLGPNGAGKSTTIKMIMGFLKPDSGAIHVLGKNTRKEEFRFDIGYLSELPNFYGHLTARETLLFSGRLSGVNDKIISARIPELLDKVNLNDAVDKRINGFSKGMKQRLGMANALIHDPSLLIFDEPMSGLDPLGRHLVKELLLELKDSGKTIFFSSHILKDIEELCDRVGVIHNGLILYDGALRDFMSGKSLEEQFVSLIKEYDAKQ